MKQYIFKLFFIGVILNILALSQAAYGDDERIFKRAYNNLPEFTMDYANSGRLQPRSKICITTHTSDSSSATEVCVGCETDSNSITCFTSKCIYSGVDQDCETNSCTLGPGGIGCS